MSSYSSSGQYYNEIYCDSVDVNKVYSVETFNGGENYRHMPDLPATENIIKLEKQLDEIRAPWTPGRLPEWK